VIKYKNKMKKFKKQYKQLNKYIEQLESKFDKNQSTTYMNKMMKSEEVKISDNKYFEREKIMVTARTLFMYYSMLMWTGFY
jgi:hypothetical protein